MKIYLCLVIFFIFFFINCTGFSGSPTSMIYPSYYDSVLKYNSNIIVTGGYSFGKFLNRVEIYNIGTNRWNFINNLNYNRAFHRSIIFENEIMITGGKNRDGVLSRNEVSNSLYDWDNIADLQYSRYSHNIFIIDGTVYVSGGYNENDLPIKTTEKYNFIDNRWEIVSDMNYASSDSIVLVVNDVKFISELKSNFNINTKEMVMIIGGYILDNSNNIVPSNKVQLYDPITNLWIDIRNMTYPRINHSVVYYNSSIYVSGGLSSPNTIERYNVENNIWEVVSNFSKPRQYHTSEVHQNIIYFIGGMGMNKKILSSVESYNIELNRIYDEFSMTNPRYMHNSILVDNGIFVLGGINEFPLNSIEFFDFSTGTWSSSYQEDVSINDNQN